MNVVQVTSLLRAFIILIGGIGVGFGLFTQEDVNAVADVQVLTPIVSGGAALVAIYFGWRARRTSAMTSAAAQLDPGQAASKAAAVDPLSVVTAAAAVPGVHQIVTDSHTAASVPSDKVVAVPANAP